MKQISNCKQEDCEMGSLRRASGFTEFAGKSGVATSVIKRIHLQEIEVWESRH